MAKYVFPFLLKSFMLLLQYPLYDTLYAGYGGDFSHFLTFISFYILFPVFFSTAFNISFSLQKRLYYFWLFSSCAFLLLFLFLALILGSSLYYLSPDDILIIPLIIVHFEAFLASFFLFIMFLLCLQNEDFPSPPLVSYEGGEKDLNLFIFMEETEKQTASNSLTKKALKEKFSYENQEELGRMWKKYLEYRPKELSRSFRKAYFGVFLLILTYLSDSLGLPASGLDEEVFFLPNIFLHFCILHYMRMRPYGFWRPMYIFLVLFTCILSFLVTSPFWVFILCLYLFLQGIAILNFYSTKNWFIEF